jgi:cytochrome P450
MSEWHPDPNDTEPELLAAYAELRESCPVAHSATYGGFTALFRYDDVVAAARDTEAFLSDQPFVERRGSPPFIPLSLNGDEHLFFRKLLARYFTPARLKTLEPRIRAMVVDHLASLLADGEDDLHDALAYPLPPRTLCAFLNVPDEEWVEFKELSKLAETAGGGPPERQEEIAAAFKKKGLELIATRRQTPHDPEIDLFARLLSVERNGKPLDDDTIAHIGWQLIAAGHSTTTRALTVAIHHLATHPDDQDALRADPEAIPTAVEELLRIGPPLHMLGRTTGREVTIDGATLPPGTFIGLNFASGNYDEAAFAGAGRCEISRKPNRHLTFGIGPHICIGAPLARLELRLTLAELLARTTRFELAGEPCRVTGFKSGFTFLPIRAESVGR